MQQELAAAFIFVVVLSSTALGVPGLVIPICVLSSPLLGPITSASVILAGLTVGSQAMFLFVRRMGRERIRALSGDRFQRIVDECDTRGVFYSVCLRMLGTPHVLVTGACAVTRMSSVIFALATMIGFAPVVFLSTHLSKLL